MKKVALLLALLLLLTGCNNYRELNHYDIVAGMAVDKFEDDYRITLEIVKLGGGSSDREPIVMEVTGPTVPKAIDAANARLSKELYFGNMPIIIISEQLARDEGLLSVLSWIVRNTDIRETTQVLISREKTAGEILQVKGLDEPIVSYTLENIIDPVSDTRSHNREVAVYSVYNKLYTPGKTLVVPAVSIWKKDEEGSILDVSQLAAFHEDRLRGYLNSENVLNYLYMMNLLKIEELVFPIPGYDQLATMRIKNSKADRSFEQTPEGIVFSIDVEAHGILLQAPHQMSFMDENQLNLAQEAASQQLQKDIQATMDWLQQDLVLDVANLGYDIYRKDEALWSEVGPNWMEEFPRVLVKVQVSVSIYNTGTVQQA